MKPPHFWSAGLDPYSREAAPLTRTLLTPLSWLYAKLSARRIAQASPEHVSGAVICVGNVTSGGSGKTPIVQALRDMLTADDLSAASLSRGYGGRLKGPLEVDLTEHTARDVGDEPLMLAITGSAWIARDRAAGARAIIKAGAQVILMDDGHQNQSLHKDLSLIVIDTEAPFGNGYVIPKGPLREPVRAGLDRADAIIAIGEQDPSAIATASGLPVFRARLKRLTDLPTGPLIAFAGIGRPERFFASIRKDGGQLIDSMSFADHHVYRSGELTHLHELAETQNATLVTTEKDFARLPAAARGNIHPIKVQAVFDDPAAVRALIHPLFASPHT